MIAKIDEKGCLHIKRKGIFKPQLCPISEDDVACGDWCPRFDDSPIFARIIICGNEIDLEIDERKEEGK